MYIYSHLDTLHNTVSDYYPAFLCFILYNSYWKNMLIIGDKGAIAISFALKNSRLHEIMPSLYTRSNFIWGDYVNTVRDDHYRKFARKLKSLF